MVFELAGFKLARIEGDHFVYTKPGVRRPIVIPDYPEVPVFISLFQGEQ
jgi:predicted RNA binding protein YcfA (HicA-like mRNA interferase family)